MPCRATICDTPNGKPIGHVVDTRDAVTPVGTDTIVFLDLGEQNGLNPGDFLTVYHPSTQAQGVRTVLGEAAILTTRTRSSVAIITSMVDFIAVGWWPGDARYPRAAFYAYAHPAPDGYFLAADSLMRLKPITSRWI